MPLIISFLSSIHIIIHQQTQLKIFLWVDLEMNEFFNFDVDGGGETEKMGLLHEKEEKKTTIMNEKEGKGKKLWKKVKYQLIEYHSLPAYLKDNEYIKGHYRPNLPLKQALFSIFSLHNETLNVWTHLIGFFIFLCLTLYTAMKIPKVVDLQSFQHLQEVFTRANLQKIHDDILTCLPSLPQMPDLQKFRQELTTSLPSMDMLPSSLRGHIAELLSNCLPDCFSSGNYSDASISHNITDDLAHRIAPFTRRPITRWPFFAFLGGAMFCLLASSICHLLSCHSERISYIMLRLDYAGIVSLISTSFYPVVYYSFMCYPFFCILYMGFITLLGLVTIVFSLFPMFQKPEFRTIRASLFSGMGLSGILPILHKQILYWNNPQVLQATSYELLMGFFYILGAVVYTTRVPERWMPGKFDVAGHSHNLFHMLVVAGAYTHYQAGLVYLQWRDLQGC